MWNRNVDTVDIKPSVSVLPVRGSSHVAFQEMGFRWGESIEADPRFRRVAIPAMFTVDQIDPETYEIKDLLRHARAVVSVPKNGTDVASIRPLRRFSFTAVDKDGGHVGLVSDWDTVVYKTTVLKNHAAALTKAKKWLDDNKPKWDSYTSEINFERRP